MKIFNENEMTVNQFLLLFSLFIYSHNIVKCKTFNLFRFDYSDWFFAIYTTIELVYEWNESLYVWRTNGIEQKFNKFF